MHTFVLIFVGSLLLVSCGNRSLTKIKDSETLRKECAMLCSQFPTEVKTNNLGDKIPAHYPFIPRENWTPAISALTPSQVSTAKYGIRIWIKTTSDGVKKGYYVFLDSKTSPPSVPLSNWGTIPEQDRMYFRKTEAEGIYEFEVPQVVVQ